MGEIRKVVTAIRTEEALSENFRQLVDDEVYHDFPDVGASMVLIKYSSASFVREIGLTQDIMVSCFFVSKSNRLFKKTWYIV